MQMKLYIQIYKKVNLIKVTITNAIEDCEHT